MCSPEADIRTRCTQEDPNFLAEFIRERRVESLFIGQNGTRTCYKAIAECSTRRRGGKSADKGPTRHDTTLASKDRTVTLRITESKTREMYSTTKEFTEEERGQRRLRTQIKRTNGSDDKGEGKIVVIYKSSVYVT